MGENLEDKISEEDINHVNTWLGAILATVVIATLSIGGKVFQSQPKINQNYTPKRIEQQYNESQHNKSKYNIKGYVLPAKGNKIVYRIIKLEPKETLWDVSASYLESFVGDYKKLPEDKKNILTYELTDITLKFNNLNWDDAKNLKPGEEIKLPELYYFKDNKTLLIFAKGKTYIIKLEGGN